VTSHCPEPPVGPSVRGTPERPLGGNLVVPEPRAFCAGTKQ